MINILAWIFVPVVFVYMVFKTIVFNIIEFFIPNKENTEEKDSPARVGRVETGKGLANATKDGEEMTDQRFNDITMYMERGCKRGIPPQLLAVHMMKDLNVTAYEADIMQKRIKAMENNDV